MRACPRFALAALLAATFLLPALGTPAVAGPEPPSLFATAYNTERKLVRSPDGTLYAAVAVNAGGVPQVRVLATRDGSPWTALPNPSLTDEASDRAALAIDSVGQLHIVWTENVTVGYERQVYYARYAGGAWTPAVQLSHSIGYAGFPSLAVDARDRVHVVWYGFDGSFYQIYYRRLETGTWTAERALTNENVDATSPAIALAPDGAVHVAWFRQNRNATINEIAYLRLAGDTVAETHAISPQGVDCVDPSLVVDTGGTVHVVWSALVGGIDRIQHVARAPVGTWSAPEFVTPAGVGAAHPSLAIHRGGYDLRVVWEGTSGPIYAQAGGSGGWSAPQVLSSGGVNWYPSARWSQDDNPLCPAPLGIDVIWTHEEGGVMSLQTATLDSPVACQGAPADLFVDLGIAVVATVVGAIAVFFVWRHRKWYPKPPAPKSP